MALPFSILCVFRGFPVCIALLLAMATPYPTWQGFRPRKRMRGSIKTRHLMAREGWLPQTLPSLWTPWLPLRPAEAVRTAVEVALERDELTPWASIALGPPPLALIAIEDLGGLA